MTQVIQALLRSVSQCPGMRSLYFRHKCCDDTEAAEIEWRCLADAVACTHKLRTLKVDCQYSHNNCNGCDIVEGALRYESLEEIYLVETSLLTADVNIPNCSIAATLSRLSRWKTARLAMRPALSSPHSRESSRCESDECSSILIWPHR